jgi:hypothetical protein
MSFIEIFAPGMRHLREERERQRHDVVHPKQGGPPFGIDLDAGTARFPVPAASPETEHRPDPGEADETPPAGAAQPD